MCVAGLLQIFLRLWYEYPACGRNSGVECKLPKLDVAGSNPVARSILLPL